MNRRKFIISILTFLIVCITTISVFAKVQPNYDNAEALERDLNAGVQNMQGKIVQFEVQEYQPESILGINCRSGENLNFISSEKLDIQSGDEIIGKITNEPQRSFLDNKSWEIYYEVLEIEKKMISTSEVVVYSKGDSGEGVKTVQKKLISLGFLNGSADGIYGPGTENAVREYQIKRNLVQTGSVTNQTLEKLESEDIQLETPNPESASTSQAVLQNEKTEWTVWIPNSGKKYHSSPACSNMKNPTEVSLSEAQARGFDACKKCY